MPVNEAAEEELSWPEGWTEEQIQAELDSHMPFWLKFIADMAPRVKAELGHDVR